MLSSTQISLIDPEDIKPLVDELAPAIAAHHARALNPSHPHQRGTAQGPDVYMQALEAANPFHKARPGGASPGGGGSGGQELEACSLQPRPLANLRLGTAPLNITPPYRHPNTHLFLQAMPEIVQAAMDKVAGITGRQYHLFDYVGHPEVGGG